MDRRRPGPIHRRLHKDGELAFAPHPNRVRSKLCLGDDPRLIGVYWIRFVGDSVMDFFRQHILTIVTFWPLAGMIVLFFFNKENKTLIRTWSKFMMIVGFLILVYLWFLFDSRV